MPRPSIHIRMHRDLLEKAKKIAKKKHRTVTSIIIQALVEWMEK